MKKVGTLIKVVAVMFLATVFVAPAVFAEDEDVAPAMTETAAPVAAEAKAPALTIDRMVICENVVDHEPVGAADTFSAGISKVYCFVEAKGIKEDTTISLVWFFHGNQMAKVDLSVKKGDRWRTYASKNLGGLKGDWKVEAQDGNGTIMKIAEFKAE